MCRVTSGSDQIAAKGEASATSNDLIRSLSVSICIASLRLANKCHRAESQDENSSSTKARQAFSGLQLAFLGMPDYNAEHQRGLYQLLKRSIVLEGLTHRRKLSARSVKVFINLLRRQGLQKHCALQPKPGCLILPRKSGQ